MKHASLEAAYLYQDGNLVEVYEENHPRAGKVEYAIITERYALNAPRGRLVLHWGALGLLPLMEGGTVSAREASIEHGSDNTRARGIPVGSLSITPRGNGGARARAIHLIDLPGLIAGGWTYQPDAKVETFSELAERGHWNDYRVAKVVRAKANGKGPA